LIARFILRWPPARRRKLGQAFSAIKPVSRFIFTAFPRVKIRRFFKPKGVKGLLSRRVSLTGNAAGATRI